MSRFKKRFQNLQNTVFSKVYWVRSPHVMLCLHIFREMIQLRETGTHLKINWPRYSTTRENHNFSNETDISGYCFFRHFLNNQGTIQRSIASFQISIFLTCYFENCKNRDNVFFLKDCSNSAWFSGII